MTTNPYFLPNVDVSNYAIKLLSDTIGTESIPIDVFEILEYIEELGVTCLFSDSKFADDSEYAITELSKGGQRQIYINSKFYGNDNAYLNEWAFRIGSCIITFLELVDTSEYSLYF